MAAGLVTKGESNESNKSNANHIYLGQAFLKDSEHCLLIAQHTLLCFTCCIDCTILISIT